MLRASAASTLVSARAPDGRAVVLKLAEGPRAERLRIEHDILQTLADVPGVPRALGLEQQGAESVLILEAVGDADLRARLAGLSLTEALDVSIGLAQVVAAVHRRGVVHGDLKPSNVMLADDAVWLIDFGLGSSHRHPRRRQRFEGTPAYMAPEQTGRTDRDVDPRSDLYALGVLIFEMVCGRLPFERQALAEYVQAHLSTPPPRADALDPAVPGPLADVIERLMAKEPDRRYQSADGLRADLEQIRAGLARGRIEPFVPGGRDRLRRLAVPRRLYGRDRVVERLIGALVAPDGPTRATLLLGPAGVGKSAVVGAVRRRVVVDDGFFFSGKFEQFRAARPFSAFRGALDRLADRLLGTPEATLARWRGGLVAGLGTQTAVIADLSPRFAQLFEHPPPPGPAGPDEARNRIRLAVTRLLQVARRLVPGPLVLALDDLQWADAGSLWLLEALCSASTGLTVLATARPVDPGPWAGLAATLAGHGCPLVVEPLQPLTDADVDALVADLTGRTADAVRPLARLVVGRSGNNPFLIGQFLTFLAEAGLIRPDPAGGWGWDADEVAAAGLPETLAETLAARLERLPDAELGLLSTAACVGGTFDPELVATMLARDVATVRAALERLREQGLVFAGPAGWRFAHDRIQEAAYARLAESRRTRLHRRIGQHLLATAGDRLDQRLFAIVDHLDRGDRADDPIRLAELNLRAGRRALDQGDWQAAATYLDTGAALHARTPRGLPSALTFDLALERAQCALLLGKVDDADTRFRALVLEAADAPTRMRVLIRRVLLLNRRNRFDEALTTGLQALAEAGIVIPRRPTPEEVDAVFAEAFALTTPEGLDGLLNMAPTSDEASRLALSLMPQLASAAFATGERLLAVLFARNLVECARRGRTPWTPSALSHFGVTVLAAGHLERGLALHRAAHTGLRRLGPRESIRPRYVISLFGRSWTTPYRICADELGPAMRAAIDGGDVEYGVLLATGRQALQLLSGYDLAALQAEAEQALEILQPFIAGLPRMVQLDFGRRVAARLRGLEPLPAGDPFGYDSAPVPLPPHIVGNTLPLALPALCVLGLFDEVIAEASRLSESVAQRYRGMVYEVVLRVYRVFAGLCVGEPPDEARRLRAWLEPHVRRCPANFAQLGALLDAEIALCDGAPGAALMHYARAVEAARLQGDRLVHGLVEERRAELYAAEGLVGDARHHRRAACAIYAAWGAQGKVDAMLAAHPDLGDRAAVVYAAGGDLSALSLDGVGEQIDVETVWRMVRELSNDLRLAPVARVVLAAALENTGATRGLLVLADEDGGLRAVGQRSVSDGHRELDLPLAATSDAPQRLIRHVARTVEPVVLARAADDRLDDPVLQRHPDSAVLCTPLTHRDALVGVLYLENTLVSGGFNRRRLEVLQLIGLQAAVSLSNARLHESTEELARTLEARVRQRTDELAATRDRALEATRAKSAFLAAMSHEIRTPMNGLMGMAQLLADTRLDPRQQDFAEAIVQSADALLTVLNDILDFSKIEADQLTVEAIPFSVREVVDGVGQLTAPAADEKGLACTVRVDPAVIDPRIGDPTRVRQVLLNLANNAVKFTERGRICIEVIAAPEVPAGVRFAVRDTGIGIPPERVDRLFRAFSQVDDSTSRRYGGTGLGLAICKRLVGLMGGEIELESVPGEGSTFAFTLPLALDPDGIWIHLPGLEELSIGLFEPDPIQASALEAALLSLGAEHIERVLDVSAIDDRHGLLLARLPLDTRAIARLKRSAAAVWLVADHGHREQAQALLDAGAVDGWLSQPVRSARLRRALMRVLALDDEVDTDRPGPVAAPADVRVLVAEDNPVNQTIVRSMLDRAGFDCVVVADGAEALARERAEDFDAILMDCQMPRMDGLEATRRLRARGCELPIIALTAGVFKDEREACLAAGMDAFLSKPVRMETLIATLQSRLQGEPEGR